MDTKKIEQFLTLAQQLNYSKAAEILNTTQPTLSRCIMSMEAELGVTLFDRTTTRMRLTPAGEYLAQSMLDTASHYHSTVQHAIALQNGFSGRIRIGFTKGHSLFAVKRILQEYRLRHPDIIFDLRSESLSSLRRMLDNHTLDFAVGYAIDYSYLGRYSCREVCHSKLDLAISADHPLAGRAPGSLHLSDFREDSFLLVPTRETLSVRSFYTLCGKAGFYPNVVEYADFLSITLGIEAGYGVAPLTVESVAYGNPAFEFVTLPELEPSELGFIWANDNDSVINRAFIEYLKSLPFDDRPPR